MDGRITVQYLQAYIKAKDHRSQATGDYFLKLTEEVGELARAMRKNLRPAQEGQIKETIEEELWDIVYYVLALANCYDIDLERVIPLKEALNNAKYQNPVPFELDR
ncbi:MAG TPA: MazG nucleotide pyrophosphohydrolase domain-containing protein [Clostridia bacterium]|nr:MazG nucleotide pyrophosphohydrolase domain-containing protein [Clostridia bacterium]